MNCEVWGFLLDLTCFLPYRWGHAMAQFVGALRYKPDGLGFDSRRCHNFSLTYFVRPHFDTGVDSAFKGNGYQEYFLGVKAAGA